MCVDASSAEGPGRLGKADDETTPDELWSPFGFDVHESSRCTDWCTEIHPSSIFYHFGLIPGGGGGAYSSCSHSRLRSI